MEIKKKVVKSDHSLATTKTETCPNMPNAAQPSATTYIYEGQSTDFLLQAWLGRFTGWLSPASFTLAIHDWLAHLAISPAKQLAIMNSVWQKTLIFSSYAFQSHCTQACTPCVQARPTDRRFEDESWRQHPFDLYAQGFLLCEQWLDEATTNIDGVSDHHQRVVNFAARQLLDVFSPSNFPWTNPEVISTTLEQRGNNFLNGFYNMGDDIARAIQKLPSAGTELFKVGKNVAITPGKVVYRNSLIELIQYEPTTSQVFAEPILICPAWIMKYYILDLSPNNSMVKYLVDKGHTVFMISWKNPSSEDRDLGLEDYALLGPLSALDVIKAILSNQKIHTVGYCIGGTLLMIAAAFLAGKSDDRLKSTSLFAAEVDFKEAGELLTFVDKSQITFLKHMMWENGYLDGAQMAGTFSMLHATDLIWSRMVRNYLLGKKRPLDDLMAWDLDTTRLPYKMHSEYLEQLFLNNALVDGHFKIQDKNVSLLDIRTPLFVVSTLRDHVAPWKSVYKIHYFSETDITFVLTSGGHNTGVVNEPGHPNQNFQILAHLNGQKHIDPETWQATAPQYQGSWWPTWQEWLAKQSGEKTKPPSLGNVEEGLTVLCDAPGTYVYQK